MTQETKDWYELALLDLNVAKHLNKDFFPKPLEIICFHCQQAAEKAIKSLIVYFGAEGGMPKVHDISFLLGQIKNKIDIADKYYEYGDELTPYGITVRYPHELFLEDRNALLAIEHAEEILEWVKETISKQSSEKSM